MTRIIEEVAKGNTLARMTVSELQASTIESLSDIGPPRLVVCDEYPSGPLLAVVIAWEDWKDLEHAINCATCAATVLIKEFEINEGLDS